MREIAVIIENRIKNSKVHEQVQRKQRKNKKLVFPKLGKRNTILLSESTSNCKNVIHSNSSKERTEDLRDRILQEVQAKKSIKGMPWHQEPTKDVTSCDKPRGAANKRNIRGFPNGETPMMKNHGTYTEYIGICGEPAELKHLSRRRKRNQTRFRK